MAFNLSNLVGYKYPNGQGIGNYLVLDYVTGDSISTIEGSGYFNGGIDKLRRGDIVRVTAQDGNALYFVENVNYPSAVDVAIVKIAVASSFVSF